MKIKVGGGLVFALYPYNEDFIGFECLKAHLISHTLKKLSCWIIRGGISLLVRVKYPIIKF
nr:hypothetical protein [Helicobacter pylori]